MELLLLYALFVFSSLKWPFGSLLDWEGDRVSVLLVCLCLTEHFLLALVMALVGVNSRSTISPNSLKRRMLITSSSSSSSSSPPPPLPLLSICLCTRGSSILLLPYITACFILHFWITSRILQKQKMNCFEYFKLNFFSLSFVSNRF